MGNGTDISNMGRCVVCGKPVDMRDEGDGLVVMEQHVPDEPGIGETEVREAMADALRQGGPKDHTLAEAYEDGEEIVLHQRCHDETMLPNLYAIDEELAAIED
jgi:hypothetical protein